MKLLKKTKIIATLGPSTDTIEKIKELYKAGANTVRMNYSHSNYEYFEDILKKVKTLNKSGETNLGILSDTKGPEIRTKKIDEKIKINKNEIFLLTTIKKEERIQNNDKKIITCDYELIIEDLGIGKIVDIDTGLLKAKIIEKNTNYLVCKALNKHNIGSKRHINLPGTNIKLPGITKSDKKDIEFAVKNGTDFIALSFVRKKENIIELRNFLKDINADTNIQIISKIENEEALKNLDEILEYSDGIMIARGDLGAEIPFERLPVVQREIGKKCKDNGKFFIIATQMLESMIENPIPTRAEVTDIFNAVMQKTDCVMLSGETANGNYPIETVETMKNVLKYSETQLKYKHKYFTKDLGEQENEKQLIKNAIYTAENINAKAIMIFTKSGFTGKIASAFRPNLPTFTFTFSDSSLKKMTILFGLKTFVLEEKSNEENIKNATKLLKEKKLVSIGNEIVTVYGINRGKDIIPSIQVIKIK